MTQRARRRTAPVATSNDGRARHPARRPRGSGQGTVTGWMVTGPRVGSSSVACETPCGVVTSTALGTDPGSVEQIGAVPPGAQTPNWNACAVGANPRAWSALNPSCPVSTTLKPQPGPGVPNADSGRAIVIVPSDCDMSTCAVPTEFPDASCHAGDAKPCTSSRWLHAPDG